MSDVHDSESSGPDVRPEPEPLTEEPAQAETEVRRRQMPERRRHLSRRRQSSRTPPACIGRCGRETASPL